MSICRAARGIGYEYRNFKRPLSRIKTYPMARERSNARRFTRRPPSFEIVGQSAGAKCLIVASSAHLRELGPNASLGPVPNQSGFTQIPLERYDRTCKRLAPRRAARPRTRAGCACWRERAWRAGRCALLAACSSTASLTTATTSRRTLRFARRAARRGATSASIPFGVASIGSR